MLTLARISPRNIYLNLLGGAHFYWRSLKACNKAKRTCSNYVCMAIFPWSYCSLKLQIFRLFRARSSITAECRFTLKRPKHPPEVFCKKKFFINLEKFTGEHLHQRDFFQKETLTQVCSCDFCKISNNFFFTKPLLTTRTWHKNDIVTLNITLVKGAINHWWEKSEINISN